MTTTQEAPTRYTPWWGFALLTAAVIAALALFVQTASQAPLVRQVAPADVGPGDPVRDGKLQFTVLDVQRGVGAVGDPVFGATPTGSYTLVTLRVHNVSTTSVTFDSSYIVGVDSAGQRVTSDRDAGFYANEGGATLAAIAPGSGVTVRIAFDVERGERLVQVQAHDSVFSRGGGLSLTRKVAR